MLLSVCVLRRPGRERWPATLQAKQTPNSSRMRSEAIKILMPRYQTSHRWAKVCKRERSPKPPWINGAHWRMWTLLWLLNRKQSQRYDQLRNQLLHSIIALYNKAFTTIACINTCLQCKEHFPKIKMSNFMSAYVENYWKNTLNRGKKKEKRKKGWNNVLSFFLSLFFGWRQ